jgi:hypothetical protein
MTSQLKKYGFGWLYMDFFWHFPILLTDDCILFGPHFWLPLKIELKIFWFIHTSW